MSVRIAPTPNAWPGKPALSLPNETGRKDVAGGGGTAGPHLRSRV